MVATSASLALSCSATSISSTPTAPVRLTDDKTKMTKQNGMASTGDEPMSLSACRLVVVGSVRPLSADP
jgi:hypothetical protein